MLYIPGRPNVKEPKDLFIQLVSGDFDTKDWNDRLQLIADVNHFKYMEDESVWMQARGRLSNWFEVYFDGVWICDFTDDDNTATVRLKFLKGFMDKYEKGEITLNTKKELTDHDIESVVDKTLRDLKSEKPKTEEDHIINEVVTELLEDKKRPKKVNNLKDI